MRIFELDSNEEVVNWEEDIVNVKVAHRSVTSPGGIATSNLVGLNETEWKQISVTKDIKFPQTAKLGIRLENVKPGSTIYWDDINVFRNPTNTDTIGDTFNYELFVKKYEAGSYGPICAHIRTEWILWVLGSPLDTSWASKASKNQ